MLHGEPRSFNALYNDHWTIDLMGCINGLDITTNKESIQYLGPDGHQTSPLKIPAFKVLDVTKGVGRPVIS